MKKPNPITDNSILARYKLTGMSDALIAQKLGTTEEEVKRRWALLIQTAEQSNGSGYEDFIQQINLLCVQYQLFGESLKIVCDQIIRAMPPSELKQMLTADTDATVKNILSQCIVLKKFTPVDPVESLAKHTKQAISDN